MSTISSKGLLMKIQKIDKNINMRMLRRLIDKKIEEKNVEPNKETMQSILKKIDAEFNNNPQKTIELFKKRVYIPGPRDNKPGTWIKQYDDDPIPPPQIAPQKPRGSHEKLYWK